ncbi:MAG TPA: serine hydrolase domain-containing protein, partial [Sphingomicrobium sp.]|nr:serine hydrolase domain-containing protein [Sphingomicrobium sp.]
MTFHSAWVVDGAPATSTDVLLPLLPWWSFTKTVLAATVLRLVERGKLELDTSRPHEPYTLRQLLLHRAGVPNYGKLAAYHEAVARGEDAWPRTRLLEAVNAEKLDFEPGTRWNYSNVGYLFARDAIERATGLPLGEALHQLVLAPLNLSAVRLASNRADFEEILWPELRNYDPQWVYHGCLIGTPVDAAKLLHGIFRGDLLQHFSIETIFERSTIFDEEVPGRPWTKLSYALGLMAGSMGDVGRAWGHSGEGPHSANAVY